ncbi:MAG TPA: NeuD/PglB/VioB family sugar acetyltransferase, partial [bacterium]|nr:NeuD/PglB/VioB family sugar acetyltransferase [bacterium]
VGSKVLNYPVIGTDKDIDSLVDKDKCFLITIGQIKSVDIRKNIFNNLRSKNAKMVIIVSNTSYVSSDVSVGDGSIIMHQAYVGRGASIGSNCIINTKALVEHDAVVGDHCHVAVGAVLSGGVKVGNGTLIGAGSVIREYIKIGSNSLVGAGSVVVKDVPDNTLVLGNPAKPVKL